MVKFSLLIANYNNEHLFEECYNSIMAQTVKDFEIIILDDCSTDNSMNTIRSLIDGDSRFKLLHNDKNSGVAFTKEKLIDFAEGEICGFLDPDDALAPNAIEIMVNAHEKNKDASIINSNLYLCNFELKPIEKTNVSQIEQKDSSFLNLNGNISHFATFKKSFYKLTSGMDSSLRIAEDQDLYLKLYEVGDSIQINDVLYYYRTNPKSLTNSSKKEVSFYWHWVVAFKTAERRKINFENEFANTLVSRMEYNNVKNRFDYSVDQLSKNRWIKLGNKLGFIKFFKKLKQ